MLQETIQKLNSELKNNKNENNIKPKRIFKKPEGINRELYSLIRGDNHDPPIMIADLPSSTKYKTNKIYVNKKKKTRKWILHKFSHPERHDNLELTHWQRVEDTESNQLYPFAKFNKKLAIPFFNPEEYDKYLVDPTWTVNQTSYLLELAEKFNINFVVIHDRWDTENYGNFDIESLKERFFYLRNTLLKVKAPPGLELPLVFFDAPYERKRKTQLLNLWNRTPEQIEEEQRLIQELKKIEARKRERERRTQDLQKLLAIADSSIAAQAYRVKGPDAFDFIPDEESTLPSASQESIFLSPRHNQASQRYLASAAANQIKLEELSNCSSSNLNLADGMSSEETSSNYGNTTTANPYEGDHLFSAPYPPSTSKKIKTFSNSTSHSNQQFKVKNFMSNSGNNSSSQSSQNTRIQNSGTRTSNKTIFQQLYQQAMFDQANYTGIKFPDYKSSGVYLRSNKMKLPISLGQKKTKAIEQALAELFNKKLPTSQDDSVTNLSMLSSNTNLPSPNATSTNTTTIAGTSVITLTSTDNLTTSPSMTPTANRYSISYYNHPYHPPATPNIVTAFNNLRNDIMLLYELNSALTATKQELHYMKMFNDEIKLSTGISSPKSIPISSVP